MPYRDRDNGAGARDVAVSAGTFDIVDSFFDRIDKIKKSRLEKEKIDKEFQLQVSDLDLQAQKFGVGRFSPTPNGQVAFSPMQQQQQAAPQLPQGVDPSLFNSLSPQQQQVAMRQIAVNQARQSDQQRSLTPEQINSLAKYATATDRLEGISEEADSKGYKTGPLLAGGNYGYSNLPGASSYRAKAFSPEESGFFSDARSAVSDYLNAATGAQRGFKEVGFLLPAVPDPSQLNPKQLKEVGKKAASRSREHLGKILDLAESSGYRNVPDVRVQLGLFKTEEQAMKAYKDGKIKPGSTIFIGGKKKKVT